MKAATPKPTSDSMLLPFMGTGPAPATNIIFPPAAPDAGAWIRNPKTWRSAATASIIFGTFPVMRRCHRP